MAEQARLAELDEQYLIALNTADNYFNAQQYAEAREAYSRAAGVKADESYPAERIAEIDNIMANIEQQRLIDDGYANAIAIGDNYFNNKEYPEAKAEYEKALGFKASEQYPQDKIAEIVGILAEQARNQEIEDNYNAAIASADDFFNNKQYEEAKTAYQQALTVKPEDAYASEKLRGIDEILTEASRLQGIEDSYNEAITTADASFNAGNYRSAKDAFAVALGIKSGEQYPKDKIIEIDRILDEQDRLMAIQLKYEKAIKKADSLFGLLDYEGSRIAYYAALELRANESHPQQKITEIDGILAEFARQKAIDKSYTLAITEADEYLDRGAYLEALQEYEKARGIKPDEGYPANKIAEINAQLSELEGERKKAYDAAIFQADSYYDLGNYRSAKASYQTAVNIKPDEKYARDRLDEVSTLYMIELETLKVEYRKFISDADNYFKGKIYDGAIENYRSAAKILPDEDYPGKMIARITKIINDNAIIDVNKLAQIIPDNTERRFSFDPLPASVRKENYIMIKAKNVSDHDFKMLVNFGQDNSKAGGVVLPVPKGEMVMDYIIRIGALYKWFSEDNNWLSIYPEGGDIEVALIRISKSD
jgi:tetratricopeptide (TPR) repeat protein